MDENKLLLAIGVVAVVFVLVVFVLMKSSKKGGEASAATEDAVASTGIPDGLEAEYMDGIAPTKSGVPVMYTLHTCVHCVHLKDFLTEHGIEHHLVYVDNFENPARSEIMKVMRTYNMRGSFPTLVLPDGRHCVGFREGIIREMFGIEE